MSRRANYFGLWKRLADQRRFNVHLHYDMDPRDIAYFCNAMEDFTALEKELAESQRRLEAAEEICTAALSALSEDGVKEYLSAYLMGIELIERVEAWRAARGAE